MGVQMFDRLLAQGHLIFRGEELRLAARGQGFAAAFGIDVENLDEALGAVP